MFCSGRRPVLHIRFSNAHLLALRTRSIPRSKELGQFLFVPEQYIQKDPCLFTIHTISEAFPGIYSVQILQKYVLHYIERKISLQFKKTGAILIFGLCGITQFLCPFAPDFRGNIGERRQNHEG